MSEWLFDRNEVIEDAAGKWWHVVDRMEAVEGSRQEYILQDATHTDQERLHKDDVEGLPSEESRYESCGWTTKTKPAAEKGFRVNGILCGPSDVAYWKGRDCVHEQTCSLCGADGYGEIDILHSIDFGQIDHTEYECRECGNTWTEDYD